MLELRSTAGRLAVPGGRAVLLGQTQGAQAGRGSSDSSARGGAAGSVTALVFGGNPVSHREPVLGGGGRGAGPGDAAKAEAGVRRPADAAEEQPAGVPRCGAPCTPAPALGGAWAPALLCFWLPLDWKHPELPARPGPSRGPPTHRAQVPSPALPPRIQGSRGGVLGPRAPPRRLQAGEPAPPSLRSGGSVTDVYTGTGVQRRPVHLQLTTEILRTPQPEGPWLIVCAFFLEVF